VVPSVTQEHADMIKHAADVAAKRALRLPTIPGRKAIDRTLSKQESCGFRPLRQSPQAAVCSASPAHVYDEKGFDDTRFKTALRLVVLRPSGKEIETHFPLGGIWCMSGS
jgi:hypothetical protein